MTDIVLQNESLLIAPDSPSRVFVFQSNLNIDNDVGTVVLKDNPSALIVESSQTFAVVNQTILSYPGSGSGNGIKDAPYDGTPYMRENGHWVQFNYELYPIPQDEFLYEQVQILNDFKDTALGFGTDPDDRFVSVNYLHDLGLIQPGAGGTWEPSGPVFMDIPPQPVGVMAIGRWDSIDVSWLAPNLLYLNHGHTKVYRGISNSFASALVLELVYGPTIYNDFSAAAEINYYYWVSFVSASGIEGPASSTLGTLSSVNDDPGRLLEILEAEIRSSQLHNSLLEPIEFITEPGGITDQLIQNATAITNESSTRAFQIEAEAVARQLGLEAEAIDRGTAISEAVTILETADGNLATKIEFITSVSNATFDTIELWQFDSSIEGWTGNGGAPTPVDGYIRPVFNTNTFITSPTVNIDGGVYPEVRMRIRKVGSPVWAGVVRYVTGLGLSTFSSSQLVAIPEPVYFNQEATVTFPMTDAPDWDISIIVGLQVQLALTTDASNYFEYDWISVGRSGPGASIAAIVEERSAWTTAVSAQAEALLDLTATVEDNTAYVSTQLTALTNADITMASQIASLSAGNNNQFDYSNIWYFDAGIESWTGNGAPTIVTAGWLRPANHATNPYVRSPVLSVDGAKYTQVRARIRKVGTPTWDGALRYITTIDSTWDGSKLVAITEPTYDGGIGLLTFNITLSSWIGKTISGIQLDVSTIADASNYFELDWVAVGRPSPGASSADLQALNTAMVTADNALAASITATNATVAGKASQTALTALQSEVTTLDGVVTAQGTQVTAIRSQLNPNTINPNSDFTDWTGTYPVGYSVWTATGFSKYNGTYAYNGPNAMRFNNTTATNSGVIATISNITNPSYVDVEITFTLVSGALTGAGLMVRWVNSGSTTYNTVIKLSDFYAVPSEIYGKRSILKARIQRPTGFTGTFSSIQLYIIGNYIDLGALSIKDIIYDRVSLIYSDASASALSTLESRVTSTEGSITAQSASITSLTASVLNSPILPVDFSAGLVNWTLLRHGAPTAVATATGTLVDDASFGKAADFSFTTAGQNVLTKGVVQILPGNIYEIKAKIKIVSFDGSAQFNLIAAFMPADYGSTLTPAFNTSSAITVTATGTVYELSMKVSTVAGTDITTINPLTTYMRFGVRLNSTDTITVRVGHISCTDITHEAVNASAISSLSVTVSNQGVDIAASATDITTLKVNAPGGGNLTPTDTAFTNDLSGWSLGTNNTGKVINFRRLTSDTEVNRITGVNNLECSYVGTATVGTLAEYYLTAPIPIRAGQQYCYSARVANHRSTAQIWVAWQDDTGASTGTSMSGTTTSGGGRNENNWGLLSVFAAAPVGATKALLVVRMTTIAASDPIAWMCKPMFGEVPASTTTPTPYSPGGTSGSYAAIQVESTVRASETGPLMAQWSVKTSVGGLVGGVGFYNDGIKTRFMIHADQFSVYSPGAAIFGLIVDGGRVVMDGANIKNASINTAQIGSLNASVITAGTINTDRLVIGAASVSAVTAGSNINFSVGSTSSTAAIAFVNMNKTYPGSTLRGEHGVICTFTTTSGLVAGWYEVRLDCTSTFTTSVGGTYDINTLSNLYRTYQTRWLAPSTTYGIDFNTNSVYLVSSSTTGQAYLVGNFTFSIRNYQTQAAITGGIASGNVAGIGFIQEFKV